MTERLYADVELDLKIITTNNKGDREKIVNPKVEAPWSCPSDTDGLY
jgi:hypothetical protein